MDYKQYYTNQIGSGLPVYEGSRYQRGAGLGSIFKGFFRWIVPVFKTHAMPLLKESAKVVGNEALKTATNIATDAIVGKDVETAAKARAQEALNNIKDKAREVLQLGDGYNKQNFNKTKIISHKSKKRKTRDIFD